VAYRPVGKQRLCKQRQFLGNGSVKTFPRQRIRKQQYSHCWKRGASTWSVLKCYKKGTKSIVRQSCTRGCGENILRVLSWKSGCEEKALGAWTEWLGTSYSLCFKEMEQAHATEGGWGCGYCCALLRSTAQRIVLERCGWKRPSFPL
jgi:hypothetical protein